jgi:Ca2+-binding RTX toxin-like protein
MPITGQLWYTTLDLGDKHLTGYFNSDGTFITQVGPTSVSALAIAVDTAAGYYFVANSDNTSISSYRISDNALIATIQIGNASLGEIVSAITIDPINHVVFANRWDTDLNHTGIVKISYDPMTGVLDPTAAFDQSPTFLVTGTSTDGNYVNATNFEIDTATHKLYYTDWDNNYSFAPFAPTNAIYVVDDYMAATPTVTKLTLDSQFPADSSNGIIGNIAVSNAKGLIYFTTLDFSDPGQGHIWYMPIAGGIATKIADLDNLNSGGVPAGLSLDPVTQQLYISTAYYDAPGEGPPNDPTADANHILVYQLSADGTSFDSLVASYSLAQLEGAFGPPTDNGAHPGGSIWNQLPLLSITSASEHAVEQGGAITIASLFSSSDDGGYYTGSTIQITGGTFSSNESSSDDDHLFVLDGMTQLTSGIFTGTNITVSYDDGTDTLTLSGYDTIANYNMVMSAAGYFATGDNPTNYGNNDTRTLTWTVSDGSLNVPAGQGQNTTTTTITIDGVNDAPVNQLPGSAGGNEDTTFALNGLSISDADADPASHVMTVTLAVDHGTLTIRTDVAGGIGAGDVTGNGTGSITLTATQNAVNATLANATGLQYSGDANFNGADTLTLTTSDNGNTGSDPGVTGGPTDEQDQDQLAINVAAVNDTPTANATSASGAEDAAPRIAITLSGSDVDADLQSFTLASLPGHGQLFTAASGGSALAVNDVIPASGNSATVYFQQSSDYNGPDSFTYTAFDGAEDSAAATASITVSAVADIVDDSATVDQNSGGNSLALLANDTFENPGRAITAITAPSHGTAVINDNGTPGNLTDDFVVYTPTAGYTGADSFTYTVTSGDVTETGTVNVTVASIGQVINGGNGNETLNGTAGDDTISGGNGNDVINAGDGHDTANGGNGNDTINGGPGNDTIYGNNGDDRIVGGTGNDTMTGGTGNDTFVFGPSFGQDTVTDLGTGDHIEFDTAVFANFAAVQAAMNQVGADTVISLGTDTITLQNVNANSLQASDFLFA